MSYFQNYEQEVRDIRAEGVINATKVMNEQALRGSFEPLKLCYKHSEKGVSGKIVFFALSENVPTGFVDTGKQLDIGVPYSNYYQWIAMNSGTLPILSY
jgi:hypothetical protein